MKPRTLRVLFTPMGRTGTKRPSGNCARARNRRPPSCLLIAVDVIRDLTSRALAVVVGLVFRIEPAAFATALRRRLQAFRKELPSTTPRPARAENSKTLLPQVIAQTLVAHQAVLVAPILPQAHTSTGQNCSRAACDREACSQAICRSPVIGPLSSDGGPRLTRMLRELHP